MKQSIVYIGIDVAKAHLDVAWAEQSRRFNNDKVGRATLVKWIKQKQSGPVQVICEASGGYEQELLDALAEAALAVSLVQATRVRQYARAAGILAKTDKVDARVLARFGAAMRPEPTSPRSAAQKLLRELESQRRHLSDLLVAEQNRIEQLHDEKLRGLARTLLGTIKKQIARIDARIATVITQDQGLCQKAQKLTGVKGAWESAPLRCCWRRCPSWARSIDGKLPLWRAWLLLIATAAPCVASAPSSQDVVPYAAASTWLHWWPAVAIPSSQTFTGVFAQKTNRTKLLSLPSCENSSSPSIRP